MPTLNPTLKKATTTAGRMVDKKMVELQQNMVAAMAATAKTATLLYELKEWAKSKAEPAIRDKVGLLGHGFTDLMDANILLTRAMSDGTQARWEMLKLTLTDKVASLLSGDNPATAEWLGGEDLAMAMDRVEREEKQVNRMKKQAFTHQDKPQGNYNNNSKSHYNKDKKKRGYSSNYDKKRHNQGNKQKSSNKDFHKRGSH